MNNLIKGDFYKFFKSKLFITLIILLFVFPLLSMGGYALVKANETAVGIFIVSPTEIFRGAFSVVSNNGFVLLILMIMILGADFTQNTIRNKVNMGFSKNQIYVSSLILTLTIALIFIWAYAFLEFAVAGMFFGFENVLLEDILEILLVNSLAFVAIFTFVQMAIFLVRTTGFSILMIFGTIFGLLLITGILMMMNNPELIKILFVWLPGNQLVFTQLGNLINEIPIELRAFASVIHIILFVGIGMFANQKIDYK